MTRHSLLPLFAASLLLALAGCDSRKSDFVSKCERANPGADCGCVYDLAKDQMSDEFLAAFLPLFTGDQAAAEREFGKLGIMQKVSFTARSGELLFRAQGQCRL